MTSVHEFEPAVGGDAKVAQRVDHPAFQGMDETTDVLAAAPEVEGQVTDPLARPVIGVAPAAPGIEHRKALGIEELGRIGAGAGGE